MRTKGLLALAVVLLALALAGVAFAGDNKGEGPPANHAAPTRMQASAGQLAFRIDTHPELDFYQPCDGGDNVIQFPINISGVDPTTATKATLTMAVWDVDFDCGGGLCERDTVYVNGHQLTTPNPYLTGANDQWSTVSFDIPPSYLKEGNNTIAIYIDTLGAGWCVSCDWAEIKLNVGPVIEDIEILQKYNSWLYLPILYPVTTQKFYVRPKMRNMTGFEIVKAVYTGDISGESVGGKEYGVTIPGGKHKEKTVKCVVTYRKVGTTQELKTYPYEKKFNAYFRRDKDDKGRLGSKLITNWFTYWKSDGAVPSIGSFTYDNTMGDFGSFDPNTHVLTLGPPASGYDRKETLNGTKIGHTYGIDTAEVSCVHELKHKETHLANPGCGWDCKPTPLDRDGDELSDDFEANTSHTSPDNPDTYDIATALKYPPYKCYGDNEYLSRMAELNGRATAVESNDWAHPGRKTTEKGWRYPAGSGASSIRAVSSAAGSLAATTGFTGSYSDAGTDADGNGLFDSLSVTVGVSVETEETYRLIGSLTDAGGAEAAFLNQAVDLAAGANSCVLDFDGIEIHRSGLNGPYRLSLTLAGFKGVVLDSKTNVYTTNAYTISQFEGQQAYLGPNITDTPVDTDADGRYEELRFSVDVVCTIAGDYEVNAFLMDGDENEICQLNATMSLTPGTSMATLVASGPAIRRSRLNGPYKLMYLEVLDGAKQTDFRYDAYTTPYYDYTQFESGLAEIGPVSSFTDQGIDTNSNTLYDILRISMPVNVIEGGAYALSGDLYDAADHLICDSYSEMTLATGHQNLNMDFPGLSIFTSGTNGPYRVRYTVLYDPGSSVADALPGHYDTAAYSFTQFEAPGAIALTKQFDDRSIDTNSDGRYEYLDVDVGVVAVLGGTYALNARLADKNGAEITWASTTVYLAAGARQMLTLRFDGNSIYDHGVDGPFHVQDIYIYNTGNASLNDTYAGPYVTKAAWNVGSQDQTAPSIVVSTDSGLYRLAYGDCLIITFSAEDAESGIKSVTATLNGQPFTSGSQICQPGQYHLVVDAVDNADNASQAVRDYQVLWSSANPFPTFQAYCGSSCDPLNGINNGFGGITGDVISSVPGIFSFDPGGPDWRNFVPAFGVVDYTVTNVSLRKTVTPYECSADIGGKSVFQHGTANITTWWPLMYELPGTTFTLTITYTTVSPFDDDGPGPHGATLTHVQVWTWSVGATLQGMKDLLELFHELPLGTHQVPLVSDEPLYTVLQAKLDHIIELINTGQNAEAAMALDEFVLEVEDACISIFTPTKPNVSGLGTGIANTCENPACCKILADADWVAIQLGLRNP